MILFFVCSNLLAQQIILKAIPVPKGFPYKVACNCYGELYGYGCFSKSTIVINERGDSLGMLSKSCGIVFGADRFAVKCGMNDKRYIYANYQLPKPQTLYSIDPLYDKPDSSLIRESLVAQATVVVNDSNEIFVHYPIGVIDSLTELDVFKGTILKKYSSTGTLLIRKKFDSSLGAIDGAMWKGNELRLRFGSEIYSLDGQLNIISRTRIPINLVAYANLTELYQGGWLGLKQDSLVWLDSQAHVKAVLPLAEPEYMKLIFQSGSGELYLTIGFIDNNQLYRIFLKEF